MIEEYVTIEPGTLLYVEATEPNTTRLFIRSLYPLEDAEKKMGWWNIFTITKEPVENAGMYIARIDRHTYDKDGHDMLIASIACPIPAQEVYDLFGPMEWHRRSIIQDIFLLSGKFSEKDAITHYYQDANNWLALYRMASQIDNTIDTRRIGDHEVVREYIAKIVDLIISGKLSIVDAVKCIKQPTDFEINERQWIEKLEGIVYNIDTYTDHPKLAEYIKKRISAIGIDCVAHNIYTMLGELHGKYISAVINGHMERVKGDDPDASWWDWHDPVYFDKLEAYLKFDAERKAKNKAAKKAAKKAKKQAANESKADNN